MRKWGKPKGHKTSEETKKKISKGVKEAYLKYKEEVEEDE